ncbi:PRD domain-containing protein [Virgibacillus siamensis]|uniref:PRD domain-containing protein n=1 Tax=Virgibacillus siamensis TaxID=480071 RepID=UPI000985DBBC|nr:PRD domain-containing protein [Virgibacillus siamensis]
MNHTELNARLNLLLEQKVITSHASTVTSRAFKRLTKTQNVKKVEQAEMLFTHLPMTLSRLENGETVGAPSDDIMREIKRSPHFNAAKAEVDFIEKEWGGRLPQEERDYLYMHYTNIIQLMQGGNGA